MLTFYRLCLALGFLALLALPCSAGFLLPHQSPFRTITAVERHRCEPGGIERLRRRPCRKLARLECGQPATAIDGAARVKPSRPRATSSAPARCCATPVGRARCKRAISASLAAVRATMLSVTGVAGTILTGGSGADTFAFPDAMGNDEVTNFSIVVRELLRRHGNRQPSRRQHGVHHRRKPHRDARQRHQDQPHGGNFHFV